MSAYPCSPSRSHAPLTPPRMNRHAQHDSPGGTHADRPCLPALETPAIHPAADYRPSTLPSFEPSPYFFPRSREPRGMKMSELPVCQRPWEERERRGSADSLCSDASQEQVAPQMPGALPWVPCRSPPIQDDAPASTTQGATSGDGWYDDLLERLAAGESFDAGNVAAMLEKETREVLQAASTAELRGEN